MMNRLLFRQPAAAWLLFALLMLSGRVRAAAPPIEPLSAFPQSLLSFRTSAGRVVNFQIWLADSPAREEQGLMFVRDLDEHAGMLFGFSADRRLSMWMKNTYLALDMLFIDGSGRITAIVRRAVPQSLDIISPPQPARAVLEIKGGSADSLGIQTGDTVLHPIFHNAK